MSAKASGSDANRANGSAHNRSHNDGSSSRAYTVEQKAAVIRIRRCQPTAFYDILGLETVKTTCGDSEIKKAYRKLSLLTHPDKNGYDGADEAFKMVSRAFQVLSDPDKKSKFDRFGGDPESRFGSGSSAASPFSGFARSPGRGRSGMFEEEISPEEMFRQFFGGGMGPFGNGFGGRTPLYFDRAYFHLPGRYPDHTANKAPTGGFGGPAEFVFNFGGGPGFRVHQFGGNRPRRRPGDTSHTNEQQPSASSVLTSLLPLLILFIFPLISALFGSISSTPSIPAMRFDAAAPPHTLKHISPNLKVPYWVNPSDVDGYSNSQLRNLGRHAESQYVERLSRLCENEQLARQQLVNEAQGWFFTDEEKLQRARSMELPNCKKYVEVNRRI